MDTNLARRIGFAVVAIPAALLVVWVGGWLLAALISTIAVLGVSELYGLATKQGIAPLRGFGMVVAAGVPLLVHAALTQPTAAAWTAAAWPYLAASLVLFLLIQTMLDRSPKERPLASVGVTLFGIGYAAVLPAYLLAIRHGQWGTMSWSGTALVFFPLAITWICDSAAMFGGRLLGGPKLAPVISPGKTRSGGVAGVVGGVLVAPLFVYVVFPAVGVAVEIGAALAMALVLSLVGQAGDLAESLFKREAGVKDSSTLIPGHGGILDRFDSLYFVLPVAAACYQLLGLA